jgi:hypothetical protein
LEDVRDAIAETALEDGFVNHIDACVVRYDKRQPGKMPTDPHELLAVIYAQKTREFSDEQEFRLAISLVGCEGDPPPYVDLSLQHASDYVRLIP